MFRYDYEECAGDPCNEMMNRLQKFVDNKENIGKEFTAAGGKVYKVSKADNFEYVDPIDQSVAKNQVKCFFVETMYHHLCSWLFFGGKVENLDFHLNLNNKMMPFLQQ